MAYISGNLVLEIRGRTTHSIAVTTLHRSLMEQALIGARTGKAFHWTVEPLKLCIGMGLSLRTISGITLITKRIRYFLAFCHAAIEEFPQICVGNTIEYGPPCCKKRTLRVLTIFDVNKFCVICFKSNFVMELRNYCVCVPFLIADSIL